MAGSKARPCGCVPTGMVEITESALAVSVSPATKIPDKTNTNPNTISNNDNDLTQNIVVVVKVFKEATSYSIKRAIKRYLAHNDFIICITE